MFVDAKDAYYAVIKHFLFDDGVLDTPEQLMASIERIHPDEDHRRILAAALVGPGLLASAEPAVQAYVRSILHGAWMTTHADASTLFEATTGTTPGAPLADVLFQLVFPVALRDLHDRLLHCEDFPWQGQEAAVLATWADDLSVPLHTATAAQLVTAAAAAARHTQAALSAIGLQVNFLPGKTEALLLWRGHGSRELRQQHLTAAKPGIPVVLLDGSTATLTITRQYVHLGGLVRDDENQFDDISRRKRQAHAMFAKLRKRLLFNLHLSKPEKLALLFALVHRSFLHGAGFWHLGTKKEAHLFHSTIMAWYRASVRPICGVSSRGLTDDLVLDLLGVLSPAEILCLEQCRLLIVAAKFDNGSLVRQLTLATSWAAAALESAAIVFGQRFAELDQLLAWIAGRLLNCRQWLRRFRLRSVHTRNNRQAHASAHAVMLHELHRSGGVTFQVTAQNTEALHICTTCGLHCGSKASLASHKSRVHGEIGMASAIRGTFCPVCGTEFWTTPRLQMHLRKRPTCLAVFHGSDVDFQKWEFTDGSSLARTPSTPVPAPQPFWATLRPIERQTPLQSTTASVVPVLQRSLLLAEPAAVFRRLVSHGMLHGCTADDFERLHDIVQSAEGGAPAAPLPGATLCTIVQLARLAVEAATSASQIQVSLEGFTVLVAEGRCTFRVS